jgi:hypothetical protein
MKVKTDMIASITVRPDRMIYDNSDNACSDLQNLHY